MQPHPDTNWLGSARVDPRGQRALDGDRALDSVARARERDHEAVALRLHLEAAVHPHLVPHDLVVLAQELEEGLVAEPLVQLRRTLDVAEQDRDSAVRGRVAAQVGPLLLDHRRDGVDRAADVGGVDPLEPDTQRQRAVDERAHPEVVAGLERLAEQVVRTLAVAGRAAVDQQLRVLEAAVGDERMAADAGVGAARHAEVAVGGLVAAERVREQGEEALGVPVAGPAAAGDDVALRVRQQVVV